MQLWNCSLLINYHTMLGAEPENTLPPASPAPFPTPHISFSILDGVPRIESFPFGLLGGGKKASKTDCYYGKPMFLETDIGILIPHVGTVSPIHLLSGFIIGFSKSKSQFGVSSVQCEKNTVAVACLGIVNLNLNCAFPVSIPYGIVSAPNTVEAGLTLGDFIAGWIKIGLEILLEAALRALGKWKKFSTDKYLQSLNNRLNNRFISPLFIRGALSFERWFVTIDAFGEEALKKIIYKIRDLFLKTIPLRYGVNPLINYFNSPDVAEH